MALIIPGDSAEVGKVVKVGDDCFIVAGTTSEPANATPGASYETCEECESSDPEASAGSDGIVIEPFEYYCVHWYTSGSKSECEEGGYEISDGIMCVDGQSLIDEAAPETFQFGACYGNLFFTRYELISQHISAPECKAVCGVESEAPSGEPSGAPSDVPDPSEAPSEIPPSEAPSEEPPSQAPSEAQPPSEAPSEGSEYTGPDPQEDKSYCVLFQQADSAADCQNGIFTTEEKRCIAGGIIGGENPWIQNFEWGVCIDDGDPAYDNAKLTFISEHDSTSDCEIVCLQSGELPSDDVSEDVSEQPLVWVMTPCEDTSGESEGPDVLPSDANEPDAWVCFRILEWHEHYGFGSDADDEPFYLEACLNNAVWKAQVSMPECGMRYGAEYYNRLGEKIDVNVCLSDGPGVVYKYYVLGEHATQGLCTENCKENGEPPDPDPSDGGGGPGGPGGPGGGGGSSETSSEEI